MTDGHSVLRLVEIASLFFFIYLVEKNFPLWFHLTCIAPYTQSVGVGLFSVSGSPMSVDFLSLFQSLSYWITIQQQPRWSRVMNIVNENQIWTQLFDIWSNFHAKALGIFRNIWLTLACCCSFAHMRVCVDWFFFRKLTLRISNRQQKRLEMNIDTKFRDLVCF